MAKPAPKPTDEYKCTNEDCGRYWDINYVMWEGDTVYVERLGQRVYTADAQPICRICGSDCEEFTYEETAISIMQEAQL